MRRGNLPREEGPKVSPRKLTQIMSTGASDPMLGEATSPLPSRRSPFPPGRLWQSLGASSSPRSGALFSCPPKRDGDLTNCAVYDFSNANSANRRFIQCIAGSNAVNQAPITR